MFRIIVWVIYTRLYKYIFLHILIYYNPDLSVSKNDAYL